MDSKKELSGTEMEKVSGGWGRDTDNFMPNVIFTESELKKLKEAYPTLKIKRLNIQSIGVPKNARAYSITGTSDEWIDPNEISEMVTSELGDISYITHEGELFRK